MARVLVVDDEPQILKYLPGLLEERDHTVRPVADPCQAVDAATRFGPDVVVLDLAMPGKSGLELLPELRGLRPAAEIIIYTGAANVERAVQAMKDGAFDFIQKPNEQALVLGIERALEMRRLREENTFLREAYNAEHGPDAFLAFSPKSQAVLDVAARYRATPEVPVLIEGESGTGKELVARFIHSDGSDYSRPFVPINCGAIPRGLVESELFGYAPGAFTGARAEGSGGKIEAAAGGTLFLDEIGELEPNSQVKLLRFLEHGTFFPVGGSRERSVRLRVVCATNRRLPEAIADGAFRRDLYYRINVGRVAIPPLRERREEVVPLARHFLRVFSRRFEKPFQGIHPEAQALLRGAPWEGNVRELRNTIERVVLIEEGPGVLPRHVAFLRGEPPQAAPGAASPGPAEAALPPQGVDLEGVMLRLIERALAMHDGNQSQAARYLGISREALRYRMGKLATRRSKG
ncbi:MAG: sigma-54-dependent transcriptional regulator [Candidatus Brocadiia bacterium]